MAVALMPAALAQLVILGTAALPDRIVRLGGIGPTDDPGPHFLDIGRNDPELTALLNPGDASQIAATAGTPRSRDDNGTIQCVAISWNGDMDAQQALDDAYDTFEAIAASIRVDPTMGLSSGYQLVQCQIGTHAPVLYPFDGGIDAAVAFTVLYTARI